jgi:hypothetical protein
MGRESCDAVMAMAGCADFGSAKGCGTKANKKRLARTGIVRAVQGRPDCRTSAGIDIGGSSGAGSLIEEGASSIRTTGAMKR